MTTDLVAIVVDDHHCAVDFFVRAVGCSIGTGARVQRGCIPRRSIA